MARAPMLTYLQCNAVLGLVLVCALLSSCKSSSAPGEHKPSGTPTDPVQVCEQHGQVCQMTSSQLGVCVSPKEDRKQELCGERFPCLICGPQH